MRQCGPSPRSGSLSSNSVEGTGARVKVTPWIAGSGVVAPAQSARWSDCPFTDWYLEWLEWRGGDLDDPGQYLSRHTSSVRPPLLRCRSWLVGPAVGFPNARGQFVEDDGVRVVTVRENHETVASLEVCFEVGAKAPVSSRVPKETIRLPRLGR